MERKTDLAHLLSDPFVILQNIAGRLSVNVSFMMISSYMKSFGLENTYRYRGILFLIIIIKVRM
jgi:hypothetical protein